MSDKSLWKRWLDYRPSKAIYVWSCLACIAATTIVGFHWGGWETAGSAANQTRLAVADARAHLMANICFARFEKSADPGVQLASLKKGSDWQQIEFIEQEGWADRPGRMHPVSGAVDLCLRRILSVDIPAGAGARSSGTAG